MNYIVKRLTEGSTYAGLGAVLVGFGEMFKIEEAAELAQVAGQAGQVVAQGGGWLGGLIALAGGIAMAVQDRKD